MRRTIKNKTAQNVVHSKLPFTQVKITVKTNTITCSYFIALQYLGKQQINLLNKS